MIVSVGIGITAIIYDTVPATKFWIPVICVLLLSAIVASVILFQKLVQYNEETVSKLDFTYQTGNPITDIIIHQKDRKQIKLHSYVKGSLFFIEVEKIFQRILSQRKKAVCLSAARKKESCTGLEFPISKDVRRSIKAILILKFLIQTVEKNSLLQ